MRHKLEEKRHITKQSELDSIKQNKTHMSWISSEMMRDRGSGPFGNYGQMLYAESLEAMERRKEKVCICAGVQSVCQHATCTAADTIWQ